MDSTDADDGVDEERLDAHLQGIEDGCGCAEVWEYTSAAREANQTEAACALDGPDVAASDD